MIAGCCTHARDRRRQIQPLRLAWREALAHIAGQSGELVIAQRVLGALRIWRGLGNDYAAPLPLPLPNHRSFAWRDYGNRVGALRLLELANAYELPFALLTNTELHDYCPEMVKAFSSRGDEIVAHGRTNGERQADMSLE